MNYRNMKYSICILLVLCLISALCSCANSNIGNPELPEGYTDKQAFEDEGTDTQTNFYIYKYDDSFAFEDNLNFEKVGERTEEIKHYFDVFTSWLEVKDRKDSFTFDYSKIEPDDYFALKDSEGQENDQDYKFQKYENFRLMLFDVSENTLYDISNYF